jgi:MGT family glycosyltransferase
MSHILVCSVPNPGHIRPMLSVAHYLANVGHRVTFHTAEAFREPVEAAGLRFIAMTGRANIDYRNPGDSLERKTLSGREQMLSTLKYWFVNPIPDQHRRIQQILQETPVDLILTDTMFFGCFPLLLGPRENRPPIVGCGVNPLMLTSIDCATTQGRKATLQLEETFQPIADCLDPALGACGAPALPDVWVDSMYTLPDLFLQFTGDAFEFPFTCMPQTIRFVGPLLPNKAVDFKEPAWWKELDGPRPVVLVTQGTFANLDFEELIQPTLSALADDDILVIAATGRTDTDAIVVPQNARVEPFIPFDRLLPKVDVLVTNGGYGAVHQALSLGIPIVIAGETEDKAFISARVGWTGVGIDLETGHPSQDQIRKAVRTVLANKRYREQAQRLQKNFARYDAFSEIARSVDAVIVGTKDASRLKSGPVANSTKRRRRRLPHVTTSNEISVRR